MTVGIANYRKGLKWPSAGMFRACGHRDDRLVMLPGIASRSAYALPVLLSVIFLTVPLETNNVLDQPSPIFKI